MCCRATAILVLLAAWQLGVEFSSAARTPRGPSTSQAAVADKTSTSDYLRLPQVHLDGTYFTHEGKRFLPVGAHLVPAEAGMQWPDQLEIKEIEADFAKMDEQEDSS